MSSRFTRLVLPTLAAAFVAAGSGSLRAQPLQLPSVARPPAPVVAAPSVSAPSVGGSVAATPAPAAPKPQLIPLPIPRPAQFSASTPPRAPEPTRVAAPAGPLPLAAQPSLPIQPVAVDTSPKAVLDRVNASLNALGSLTADFVQTGGNGRRVEGKLYLQKPGRLRFEYTGNAALEIVADGSSVVIRDRKLGTQDMYGIGQTPLKFLLRDKVDIARDMRVVDINPAPDLVSVQIEDRATFGGTSKIELFFDPKSYALKQWTVIDPQGYQTAVALRNVDTSQRPDPSLFQIDYSKSLPNMSGSANR